MISGYRFASVGCRPPADLPFVKFLYQVVSARLEKPIISRGFGLHVAPVICVAATTEERSCATRYSRCIASENLGIAILVDAFSKTLPLFPVTLKPRLMFSPLSLAHRVPLGASAQARRFDTRVKFLQYFSASVPEQRYHDVHLLLSAPPEPVVH